MKSFMNRALDLAEQKGAQHADIRIVENLTETITVKDGVPETINKSESTGFGVRTLADGAWGFASSDRLSIAEMARAAGVVTGPVYDRRTAHQAVVSSTGHVLHPSMHALSPLASNLFLSPGESGVEEMIKATRRGLYITRFWYTRQVHPRGCVVTGMTRDGVFWIENGEIAYPVKNLRFTQSYVDARNEVEEIGRETRLLVSNYGKIACRVPAVKLACFNFTGVTA